MSEPMACKKNRYVPSTLEAASVWLLSEWRKGTKGILHANMRIKRELQTYT